MTNEWLSQRMGISDIEIEAQSITQRYLLVDSIRTLSNAFVQIFVLLYIIEVLGFYQAGIVLGINLIASSIIDYPTGGLADTIGHKKVLLIAYVFHILFYGIILIASTFDHFVIASLIWAIAFAQESGALEAWFDNSYKITSKKSDIDRKIYGVFQGKKLGINQAINAIFFVVGGIISQQFSRQILFTVNIGVLVFVFLAIFFLIYSPNNKSVMESTDEEEVDQDNESSILQTLLEGIRFATYNKRNGYYFLGQSILFATGTVWYLLFLFPYYSSYSGGRDDITGVLRSILFLIGILAAFIAAKLSKSIKNLPKWIIISSLMIDSVFLFVNYIYYILVPPPTQFELLPFIGVILVFNTTGGLFLALFIIILGKYELDYFPDNLRNSLLSFRASLATAFAFPLQIFAGWVVVTYNFATGILVLALISVVGISVLSLSFRNPLEDYQSQKERVANYVTPTG
ncbi:MAG: MFS transporter [Candidatus Heimdallarchaeota archaeon]|nr:MFS transporter [Candidatus Heimdallarchaeota archaeon]